MTEFLKKEWVGETGSVIAAGEDLGFTHNQVSKLMKNNEIHGMDGDGFCTVYHSSVADFNYLDGEMTRIIDHMLDTHGITEAKILDYY